MQYHCCTPPRTASPSGLQVMGFTSPSKKNVFSSLVKAGKCDNVWAMCMYEGSTSNGTLHSSYYCGLRLTFNLTASVTLYISRFISVLCLARSFLRVKCSVSLSGSSFEVI